MNISLGDLPIGTWREFTADELAEINRLVQNSSKTADVSNSKGSESV
jgi:23S rRNA pseudouridine2604 synthase